MRLEPVNDLEVSREIWSMPKSSEQTKEVTEKSMSCGCVCAINRFDRGLKDSGEHRPAA